MSAVPRLLADTVHSCSRGSRMQESTWEETGGRRNKTQLFFALSTLQRARRRKEGDEWIFLKQMQSYLCEVGLTGVQRDN